MSSLIVPFTIGEMVAAAAARSLEADWGLGTRDPRLATDAGVDDPSRWEKVGKRNWLEVALAAIGEPIGVARRFDTI